MLGIPSDMCGNTQCYFPGDACRRHIRIKSFRDATYTFRYVRAVYQRTLFPLFPSAAICNSWDRRARIFKWPTSRFKSIASFSSWLPLEDSNESSRNKISTQDLSEIVRSQDVSSLIRELRSCPRIQMAIKGNDEIPVVNYPIRPVMSCESFFRCSCTTILPRNGLLPSLCNIAVLTLFSPATISSRYEFPPAGSLSRFQRCSLSRSSLQQVFLLHQLFRQ